MAAVNREQKKGEEKARARANINGGQFLTFALGNEHYGLEIMKVREIIGIMDITPLPKTPDYIKGVINLRGTIVPIIDLRLKFGMPHVEYTHDTCVIVVSVDSQQDNADKFIGIIVDRVSEVVDITDETIDPPPSLTDNAAVDYIAGVARLDDGVKILLDIDQVLDIQKEL